MSKPINEMGWDELVPGAALLIFDGIVDYNICWNSNQKIEDILKQVQKVWSVGDWGYCQFGILKHVLTVKTVGFSVQIHQLLQEIKRWRV